MRSPLTFHNNPPTTHRPRHRHRHVSSYLAVDSAGREHLLLNFYVRGSSKSEASTSAIENEDDWLIVRYMNRGWRQIQGWKDTSWDEALDWGKDRIKRTKDSAGRLFLYLTGEPTSSPSTGSGSSSIPGHTSVRRDTQIGKTSSETEKGGGGFWGGVAGLFSGLGKGLKGGPTLGSSPEDEDGRWEIWNDVI